MYSVIKMRYNSNRIFLTCTYKMSNINLSLTAPDDYLEISETVEFSSGSEVNYTICRDIIITDDLELEGNETLSVQLNTSVANVTLLQTDVTILILDNDSK